MTNYRFIQLDVFTREPFAGNALAVFPEAEGLTDEQMMKIAREMNLSETVFVLKPEKKQSADSNQRIGEQKPSSQLSNEAEVLLKLNRSRFKRTRSLASSSYLYARARNSFRRSSDSWHAGTCSRMKALSRYRRMATVGRASTRRSASVCYRSISSLKRAFRFRW